MSMAHCAGAAGRMARHRVGRAHVSISVPTALFLVNNVHMLKLYSKLDEMFSQSNVRKISNSHMR